MTKDCEKDGTSPSPDEKEFPLGPDRLGKQLSREGDSTLETKVAVLERRISDLENPGGWKSVTKTIALVLGVLAALFALPRGVIDAWDIFRGEQVEFRYSSVLGLSLNLQDDVLSFNFHGVALKQGEGVPLLTDVSAMLRDPQEDPIEGLPFSLTDFTCFADGKEFRFPLSVGSEGVSIACTLSSRWDGRAKRILKGDGEKELEIRLSQSGGPTSFHKFCFILPVQLEKWAMEEGIPLTFEEAKCTPVSK